MRTALAGAIAVASLAWLPTPASAQGNVVIATSQGSLRGESAGGVRSFKNIPFAAPPTGDRRWRPPGPAPAWTGERDARSFGAQCPQPISQGAAGGLADRQSEDCLQLNVFAPDGASNLPVMVWIPGGAFRVGSATFPYYDGSELAKQGVIVVTVNYRLGLLGYYAHPALTAEVGADAPLGNFGLMDQLAALRWVKSSIAAFGGDPAQVTVFGESAGGSSVLYLLTNEAARGLFSRAIVQSGGGLYNPPDLATQEQAGRAAAERIGLRADATAADLRAAPATHWVDALGGLQGGGFGPFVDGRLVREPPWRAFAAKREIDVPLLIGANSNEASLMALLGIPMQQAELFFGPDLDAARRAYGETLAREEFLRQAMGDAWFVAPARWIAGAASTGAPSYLYHFSYVAERRRGSVPGAVHGADVLYVFQTWKRFPALASILSENDDAFSRGVSACWIAFAKTGRPACPLAPDWPAYDPQTDQLVEFGPVTAVRGAFRKAQLDLLVGRFLANQTPAR